MEYKVVPFDPGETRTMSSDKAAEQLEGLISEMSQQGWEYVRLETINTMMAGTDGCFGIGGEDPQSITYAMAVFRK